MPTPWLNYSCRDWLHYKFGTNTNRNPAPPVSFAPKVCKPPLLVIVPVTARVPDIVTAPVLATLKYVVNVAAASKLPPWAVLTKNSPDSKATIAAGRVPPTEYFSPPL